MTDVVSDLFALYEARGLPISAKYSDVCKSKLGQGLAYSTPTMYGITSTILSSALLFAHNLVQNAVDEAKGAARVKLMADRYASGELRALMDRHVADEFKHSVQFRQLIKVTGLTDFPRADDDVADDISKVLDFDDDLTGFICRVHSIEIRSWNVLRMYIDILAKSDNPKFRSAIPVLEDIMSDEITHVIYTGQQLSRWIADDERVADTLAACFDHTNHETWRDMANMTEYLAEHHDDIWLDQNLPTDPVLEAV